MNRLFGLCLFTTLLAGGAGAVGAQTVAEPTPDRWYARVGPARAIFHENAKVIAGGAVIPGNAAALSNNWAFGAELGYFFRPEVSVALTIGVPPTTTLSGAGALAGVGPLAKLRYGPAVAAVKYHFTKMPVIKPYIGAGINYTLVVKTTNVLLRDMQVDDAVGPVVVGGVEIPISKRLAIFADYKKIWANTHARFLLPTPAGLAPGTAKVELNPMLIHAGLSVRF